MNHEVYDTAGSGYVVVDHDGYRYLMNPKVGDVAHGLMALDDPEKISADYIRAMMGAVLFRPNPAEVLIVGLGPGMQAKFIHRRMPDTHVVAVEIDPEIVAIARRYFSLPADDARLSTVIDDGARHIANQCNRYDIILSDCFDSTFSMVESLTNEAFYRSCRRALREEGVLCINVLRSTAEWQQRHVALLRSIFAAVIVVPVSREQNVVMAFNAAPALDLEMLAERARMLEPGLQIGLPDFVEKLPVLFDLQCRASHDAALQAASMPASSNWP